MDSAISSPKLNLLDRNQDLGQRLLPLPSAEVFSLCIISARWELEAPWDARAEWELLWGDLF